MGCDDWRVGQMACWNGLSREQQTRLIQHGNLPFAYEPKGECPRPAQCEIVTEDDTAPGPRFYCYRCAVEYLAARADLPTAEEASLIARALRFTAGEEFGGTSLECFEDAERAELLRLAVEHDALVDRADDEQDRAEEDRLR